MRKSEYFFRSLINAAGVFVYTSGVAWLGFNSQTIFGGKPDNFLMPLFALLLFVISASVTSLMVLGKPISLYFNGLGKEAFTLLFATLGWLILFLAIVVALLLIR